MSVHFVKWMLLSKHLLHRLLLIDSHVCPWWLAYSFDNPIRNLIHPTRSVLGQHIHEGMTVVDVGCGMGHFSIGMDRLVGHDGPESR